MLLLCIYRKANINKRFTEFLDPLLGTEDLVGLTKVVAVLVVLALELDAALIVNVVDEAGLGLVGVGKARVHLWRPGRLLGEVAA